MYHYGVIPAVLRRFGPFPGILSRSATAAATTLVAGCIFSGVSTRGLAVPSSESVPYDGLTDAPADAVVELFHPYLDTGLGVDGQTSLHLSLPARVRERETGRVVEYRMSSRGYGSWNAERERLKNLFLLRAYFFHPGVFEDTAGLGSLDSLYARARKADPYTRYVDSAQAESHRLASRTTVRPRVLGIQVGVNDAGDTVFLRLVAPGSPADKAGLRRGMPVLAVNDSVVTGDSAFARFSRFVDADTVSARLTVGTPSGPRTETIVRDTARFPTMLIDSLGGAGYIAVSSFTRFTLEGSSTHTEFRAALDATRRFPATVLDLRDNGGGDLGIALRMCDELLSGGVIIRLVERGLQGGASLRIETTHHARPGDRGENRSWVILANGGTASASEILVSALRENLGAPFVGSATYGKGVGQASVNTDGGGIAIITYGQARTASGASYHGVGIAPTHPSSAKPDAMLAEAAALAVPGALARRAAEGFATEDARRAALIEWNRRQAMRPEVKEWGAEEGITNYE